MARKCRSSCGLRRSQDDTATSTLIKSEQHVQYFSLAVSRWQPLRLAAPSLTSSAMPSIPSPQILTALLARSVALVVVHPLGRFAYTPLLPLFLNDGLFILQ